MVSPRACAELVDVFPDVLRLKRAIAVTAATTPTTAVLAAVLELERPRVSELAEHLHLDMSTVSRHVAHLRRRSLLDACPDPADGRSQRLTVTEAGVAELRRSRRAMVAELVRRLADWDDADVIDLTTLLGRLSRSGHAATDERTGTSTPSTADAAPGAASTPQMQENA